MVGQLPVVLLVLLLLRERRRNMLLMADLIRQMVETVDRNSETNICNVLLQNQMLLVGGLNFYICAIARSKVFYTMRIHFVALLMKYR